MTTLPYHIRRRQRRFVLTIGTLSVAFFFMSISLVWIAAGMMISSDKFCEVMMPCYQAKIAQYQHSKTIPAPKTLATKNK